MKIWNRTSAGAAVLLATVAFAGCGGGSGKSASVATTKATATATTPATEASKAAQAQEEKTFGKIKLSSAAFKAAGPIAAKYTCDGAGTSPPLQWHGVPPGTAELFLLAIDLNGSTSEAVQWAVANISPSATSFPAGGLPAGAVAGANGEGKPGWGGICGAKGQLHRVGFLLYALKHKLGLKAGFDPVAARGVLKGATLATGLTLATYKRP